VLEDTFHLNGAGDKIINKMIELNSDADKKNKYFEKKNRDPDSP